MGPLHVADHRETASPQLKGIQINRNYIPVGVGDKFNIRPEQQVKLGLLAGGMTDGGERVVANVNRI
jgi:hypothetical protein